MLFARIDDYPLAGEIISSTISNEGWLRDYPHQVKCIKAFDHSS